MPTFIAAVVTHSLRVAFAALAMLAIAIVLWLAIGVATALLGVQTPGVVLFSAGAIALAALLAGGYVSARRFTPQSTLHPALAGTALGVLSVSIFTSGLWSYGIGVAAASGCAALAGALIARFHSRPPNNSLERTRDE